MTNSERWAEHVACLQPVLAMPRPLADWEIAEALAGRFFEDIREEGRRAPQGAENPYEPNTQKFEAWKTGRWRGQQEAGS